MKKLSLVLALTLVFALLALTACSPVDGIKKKLEDNDYSVEVYDNEKIKEDFGEDAKITDALFANKNLIKTVFVFWFANEDDAAKFKSDKFKGFEVHRNGKMVAFGDTDSIELIK